MTQNQYEPLDESQVVTTNAKAWDTFKRYRDELNDNSRKAAFAGAALAWTLKNTNGYPALVAVALMFFVLYFAGDLSHYFVGYRVRRAEILKMERANYEKYGPTHSLKADYTFNQDIDKWVFRCVNLKLVLLAIAFVFLLCHLWTVVDPITALSGLLPDSSSTIQSP